MKYLIIFVILIHLLSCQPTKPDTNEFLTDKIWIEDGANKNDQYYFSSKDGKRYLWMSYDTSEFSLAEGTPENNMLLSDSNIIAQKSEGWMEMDHYKIAGDTLYTQRIKDKNGENVTSTWIGPGKDTTIGIVDYHTIHTSSNPGHKWLSLKDL